MKIGVIQIHVQCCLYKYLMLSKATFFKVNIKSTQYIVLQILLLFKTTVFYFSTLYKLICSCNMEGDFSVHSDRFDYYDFGYNG